jgi:hypothetical protein
MVLSLHNEKRDNNQLIKSSMSYYIKITGGGSREDISKALDLISKQILTAAVEDLDGCDWNDCTLTTEVHMDESGPFDQLGYEQTKEE